MPEILTFYQGLDSVTSPDKLQDGFVQQASNIDFSLEPGAARVRRGSVLQASVNPPSAITELNRHYTDPSLSASPYYAVCGGEVFRSTNGTTYIGIAPGTIINFGDQVGFSAFKNFAYITAGTVHMKDDGTTRYEWVSQSPADAPTVVLATATGLTVTATWSVTEGSPTGNQAGTATGTATSSRVQFDAVAIATNLGTNVAVIGDFGVDYLEISLSEPRQVTRISRDYSIGDANFTSYWHAELWPNEDAKDAYAGSLTLVNALLNVADDTDVPVDNDGRQLSISRARRQPRFPVSRISAAASSFNSWAVGRGRFELVGPNTVANWDNIGAARIIVEGSSGIVAKVRNWSVRGDSTYPLNDPEVGYSWWNTWARIVDGVIFWESAHSPSSTRVKSQGARAAVVLAGTATGTEHGFTHRLVYRQGGLLPAPYRVGTFTGTTAGTFTDTTPDVTILMRNQPMKANIRNTLPTELAALSDMPWQSRLFGGYSNKVIWSLPGNPDSWPTLSEVTVSHEGDNVKKILVWPPGIVIVNRDSVYEMAGSIFEGQNQNWIVQRSGSRHGAASTKSCIKTEHGIFLLNQDGFYMYVPSQGVDVPIQWANDRLKPVFEGPGTADPAALDGSRVPAANLGSIFKSVAAYQEGKLYVGIPTGTSTNPNTLFLLDFNNQRCQHFTYPWSFNAIMWDRQDNKILIGATDGAIYRAEIGVNDTVYVGGTATSTGQGVPYSLKSKLWTTPADTVMENISIEHRASGTATVSAIYDGTSTTSIGLMTNTNRTWLTPPLSGTVARSVAYTIAGSQSDNVASFYNIAWDTLVEPVRIKFYRTEYFTNQYDGEKLWDVHFADMEILGTDTTTATGTVLATVLVDNTVVMTNTYVGPPTGRQIHPRAYPFDTFGDVGHTVYNSVGETRFKLWNTNYACRNEPPRITQFQSDTESLEENICDGLDVDINPLGTAFSTAFVDGTATLTSTWTGTRRQSFTWAFPNEVYGRTIYVNHQASSGGFIKHYKTWFHLRLEPDRWQNFVSNKQSGEESIADAVDYDLNCLGQTVLATAVVDGSAVGTFTLTGSTRQSYTNALPNETYGRTYWTIYNVSGGGRFKHYNTWFHLRPEPDRWTNFVADRESLDEAICDAFDSDINCLGNTVLATAMVDNVAINTYTMTGAVRQSYTNALSNETYGRTLWIIYNVSGGGRFKHFKTWYHKRPEPDRWTNFVTDRESGEEQFFHAWDCDINCLGNTVLATSMIDGTAVSTQTLTGTGRQSYVFAYPEDKYGRTYWTIYNVNSGARFKHFKTWYHTNTEPDRVTLVQWGPQVYPSDSIIKTWVAELNPLGTSTGTILVEGTAVSTQSFVGTRRQTYNIGLPNITVGGDVDVIYTNATTMKHYKTFLEAVPKPFGKKTWLMEYKKVGGASQLDFGRFFGIDGEPSTGTATVTSVWDLDGVAFQTNTLTYTGRNFNDRVPFSPGARAKIYQQRITSDVDFRVWRSTLDLHRVGRKGVSVFTLDGEPTQLIDLAKPDPPLGDDR